MKNKIEPAKQTGKYTDRIKTKSSETPLISEEFTNVNKVEEIKEPTIFDKHRKLINQANDNYLHNHNYQDIIEILRYVEKRVNKNIPINLQCPVCVIDLVKMFSKMEK